MQPLTTKQYALLRYMYDYQAEHGYPAMIKELAYYFGVNRVSITQRVQLLARKGYVEYERQSHARVLYMPGMIDIGDAA